MLFASSVLSIFHLVQSFVSSASHVNAESSTLMSIMPVVVSVPSSFTSKSVPVLYTMLFVIVFSGTINVISFVVAFSPSVAVKLIVAVKLCPFGVNVTMLASIATSIFSGVVNR